MSREWKSGDVAMVTAANRRSEYRAYYDGKTWRAVDADIFCVDRPETHRALVVIDPEDREQARRLAFAYDSTAAQRDDGESMQAALRSLIPPPKPEEPTGRYAAVEDSNGGEFVRLGDGPRPWMYNGSPSNRDTYAWTDFRATKILSPGVTP